MVAQFAMAMIGAVAVAVSTGRQTVPDYKQAALSSNKENSYVPSGWGWGVGIGPGMIVSAVICVC